MDVPISKGMLENAKVGVHRGKKDTWGRNWIHPGRLTWNLLINHLERKMYWILAVDSMLHDLYILYPA